MPDNTNEDDQINLLLVKAQNVVQSLTRFQEFITSLPPPPLNQANMCSLKARFKVFEPKLNEYMEITDQLAYRAKTLTDELSLAAVEELYFSVISQAQTIFDNSAQSNHNNLTIDSAAQGTNVKLPTISVPKFKRDIFEFASFIDIFNAVVDSNASLSGVEKFFYLKQSLEGSAAECISGMQMSNSNYKIALENLKARYDNRKLQVLAHVEALFSFSKMSRESTQELRKFSDLIEQHVRGLDNIELDDAEFKAAVFAYLIKNKTDYKTASEYLKVKNREISTLKESREFLTTRCLMLESLLATTKPQFVTNNHKPTTVKREPFKQTFFNSPINQTCSFCKGNHFISSCTSFLNLSPKERSEKIKGLNTCSNCLRHSAAQKCKSTNSCKFCKRNHHSLLCFANLNLNKPINVASTSSSTEKQHAIAVTQPCNSKNNIEIQATPSGSLDVVYSNLTTSTEVLLSTAEVFVFSDRGNSETKCLLDSGSQSNFVTQSLCEKLNAIVKPMKTIIKGVNSSTSQSMGVRDLIIRSMKSNFNCTISCLVVPKITSCLPRVSFNKALVKIPVGVQLADEKFNKRSQIDILIGADTFYSLLLPEQITLGKNGPTLQNSKLGYIISGRLPTQTNVNLLTVEETVANHSTRDLDTENLNQILEKFWLIEGVNPSPKSLLSPEHQFCEDLFKSSVSYNPNENNKTKVSIPFNEKLKFLGDSRDKALKRFLSLEKQLQLNDNLKNQYISFMRKYENLGHMAALVEPTITNDNFFPTSNGNINASRLPLYYLPHHPVIRSQSLTTKLRVVFDGSAKTSFGISINDTQIVGPLIQDDLFSILLRFRQFEVALIGDVEKMYRMIDIDKNQRNLQCIFWREEPSSELKTFRLNTVTYGTSSASYLATRCLQFISDLCANSFPQVSSAIWSNFYMDDLLVSTTTVKEMQKLKGDVTSILDKFGFSLRKFLSNKDQINNVSDGKTEEKLSIIPLSERENTKTLGLHWDANQDMLFCDTSKEISNSSLFTKRAVLSIIAQIYDPLGLISPVILLAKIVMQATWQQKIGWDEQLPKTIVNDWLKFTSGLNQINQLRVQRFVVPTGTATIEIHGFSDASSKAYGASIYIRCVRNDGEIFSNLLCSKSKVAPLRTISIPRLELCAAVLLTQLILKVKQALNVRIDATVLWSDSKIVLQWINSVPNRHKVFVANRIAQIQENNHGSEWRHIDTKLNPADILSRGSSVSELKQNSLWWHGPSFLKNNECHSSEYFNCDSNPVLEPKLLELKQEFVGSALAHHSSAAEADNELFEKFSRLNKLLHVHAYVLRFIQNCKCKSRQFRKVHSYLTVGELENSMISLVRISQKQSFKDEIKILKSGNGNKLRSNLASLNVFIDENDCIRVGGRLQNSHFSYNKKFLCYCQRGIN